CKVVNLIGTMLIDGSTQGGDVEQIKLDQLHMLGDAKLPQPSVGPGGIGSHLPEHPISALQEKLREIGAVLAGGSRNQRCLRHRPYLTAPGLAIYFLLFQLRYALRPRVIPLSSEVEPRQRIRYMLPAPSSPSQSK